MARIMARRFLAERWQRIEDTDFGFRKAYLFFDRYNTGPVVQPDEATNGESSA